MSASTQLTLLDVAKEAGTIGQLVEENLRYSPELSVFPTRSITGRNYKTFVRTAFPDVGFRTANDGHTPGKSTFEQRFFETYLFGGVIQFDKAIVQGRMSDWEMKESNGVVKNALLKLGSQIWYGTTTDSKGFPGIKAVTALGGPIVLDATGNTSSTQSSAYFVKFGEDDATLILGEGGMLALDPFENQLIDGITAGTKIPGRVSSMTAWAGLQVGNVNCVGRIANLTVAVPLTDSLISQLLEKFPVGYTPDAIFINRRSRGQLQRSRSVVLQGQGKGDIGSTSGLVAPLPTEAFGIPIITTDSILSTDAHE